LWRIVERPAIAANSANGNSALSGETQKRKAGLSDQRKAARVYSVGGQSEN